MHSAMLREDMVGSMLVARVPTIIEAAPEERERGDTVARFVSLALSRVWSLLYTRIQIQLFADVVMLTF